VNNSLRPDLVGDPAVIESTTQWFNNQSAIRGSPPCRRVHQQLRVRATVSANGVFHFGNLGRNAVYARLQ